MRRCSPDSTSKRSPDSPDRDVHLTPRTGSRDPRRHLFDAVVAAFVAPCRAAVLSERTIAFYLEALNSYRAFAGGLGDPTLADLTLDCARAWPTSSARPETRHRRGAGAGAARVRELDRGPEVRPDEPLDRLQITRVRPRTRAHRRDEPDSPGVDRTTFDVGVGSTLRSRSRPDVATMMSAAGGPGATVHGSP
jgi:hypothetical protein